MRLFMGAAILFSWSVGAKAQNAPEACGGGKCIQVGSYNIELLGNERAPFDGVARGARSDAEIDRLVNRMATELDLEIVVFEEINTHSDQWKKLRGKMEALGYKFFEGASSDRNQFVVLAWDADEVTLEGDSAQELDVRAAFKFDDGCTEDGLRRPVAGRFQAGEFDFWVIGVHLKSRIGEEFCTTEVRLEQSKDLAAKIDQLIAASGERDVLIVGDFNERRGHKSFKPLEDAGFISQMKFLMPQSAKGSFVKNRDMDRSADLIDQVMLRYSDTKEVVPNSAFVMPLASREDAKRYVIEQSDHVPICVSFSTAADLDEAN